MIQFATTDLCDANEDALATGSLAVFASGYLCFGAVERFAGPARTIRTFEDNSAVRTLLEGQGAGYVLVIDGGASLRCALVGGNLAALGARNGWAGIVVHGCVRDADELDACAIGVRALATNPRRSAKRGAGEIDVAVVIGSVRVASGDWIYADRDGMLASPVALHA